ncbi:hypothetical protein BD626DRAFT_510936 [Schizophyllum amplum]|uniref:Uncharacterized protein n=1 Tax=Schizophyllum amplum TaxID=97359 RepID=A0A550C1I2_9AGAR|nr:hypothetical protein BD626DRAFT_510936 [Auriculariopsis ampla]
MAGEGSNSEYRMRRCGCTCIPTAVSSAFFNALSRPIAMLERWAVVVVSHEHGLPNRGFFAIKARIL